MRFTRQSQSCTAGSRLFLHADIFDDFLKKLADKTSKLKIGNPLDPGVQVGPLFEARNVEKTMAFIQDALPRLLEEGVDLEAIYVASPELFDSIWATVKSLYTMEGPKSPCSRRLT